MAGTTPVLAAGGIADGRGLAAALMLGAAGAMIGTRFEATDEALLDAEEKAQLKETETAWIKYRDLNCEFVADQYKGGSIRPMIHGLCLADVTRNRTAELKNQIKDRSQ